MSEKYCAYKPTRADRRRPMRVGAFTIQRSQIPEYFDEYYWSCFDLWDHCRRFKTLPFAGGWAEQPEYLLRILKLFEEGSHGDDG